MKKVVCANGHFYDKDRFASCPICGQSQGETELKSGRPDNPAFESVETVPLPQSSAVDELASTTWISPDEMRKLWGEDAPKETPSQDLSDRPESVEAFSKERYERPKPPEEPRKAISPSQPVDELASTVWIAPDLERLSEGGERGEKTFEKDSAVLLEETGAAAGKADAPKTEGTHFSAGKIPDKEETSKVQRSFDAPSAVTARPNARPRTTLARTVAASDAGWISPTSQEIQRRADKPVSAFLPVGWLVGLSGLSKGKVFPCKSGRNLIGRGPLMDITIPEELSVDRVNHAQIIYEPKKRQFFIQVGNSRSLSYVNHELVFTHEELHVYDRITLGKAEFLFLPLCGERFDWDTNTLGSEGT